MGARPPDPRGGVGSAAPFYRPSAAGRARERAPLPRGGARPPTAGSMAGAPLPLQALFQTAIDRRWDTSAYESARERERADCSRIWAAVDLDEDTSDRSGSVRRGAAGRPGRPGRSPRSPRRCGGGHNPSEWRPGAWRARRDQEGQPTDHRRLHHPDRTGWLHADGHRIRQRRHDGLTHELGRAPVVSLLVGAT